MQDTFSLTTTTKEKALLASYKVAYRVAKTSNPHTSAEKLILPAAVEMIHITWFGEREAAKLKTVLLFKHKLWRILINTRTSLFKWTNPQIYPTMPN